MTSLHLPGLIAFSLLTLALVLVAVGVLSPPGRAHAGADQPLQIVETSYCDGVPSGCANPLASTIAAGTTVHWIASDPGGTGSSGTTDHHSVTQCTDATFTTCIGSGGFDSGIKNPSAFGTELFQFTFSVPDTYYYHCEIHPADMRGVMTVVSPSPTPSPTDSPTPSPTPTPQSATPTPTASPTPSPEATPSPTATAALPTPTGAATHTASATPTVSPTPTNQPTGTPPAGRPGDTDCDGDADENDSLAILSHVAKRGGSTAAGTGCAPIGTAVGLRIKGDVDCSGAVDTLDALVVLLAKSGLPLPISSGCPSPTYRGSVTSGV